jgi:carboxypeptidase Q
MYRLRSSPPRVESLIIASVVRRCFLAVGLLAAIGAVTLLSAQERPAAVAIADTSSNAEAVLLDKKIMADAKNGSEIMKNLQYLSDVLGPRLTGSANLKRANEWTAKQMENYGLSNVHLEPWEIPAGWERGTAYARIIEPDNGRTLFLASMGWTPGTKGRIQGDVVILDAKTKADLAKYKGKLKDAIILTGSPRDPNVDFMSRLWDGDNRRNGRAGADGRRGRQADGKQADKAATPDQRARMEFFRTMMMFRREMADFLRSEGAALMLMDAGKPWGMMTVSGSWAGRDRGNAAEAIPFAMVPHNHYALLYRLATRPAPARTRLEVEINNKLIPGPVTVYNTVGEIIGKEKPDEYVVLGAHLDSWDLGSGTTDNGTGSSIVLEAARILAKCGKQPRRTIRFILFSGEEQGLYGSKAYVKAHKDELPRISFCLVHDTGTGKVVGLGLQGRAVLKDVLQKEVKELGDFDVNLRGMGGSDHASFEEVGVPGFAFQQDMSTYNMTHHSISDTFDAANEKDLIQGAQAMALIGMRVANMPLLLQRDKEKAAERESSRKVSQSK